MRRLRSLREYVSCLAELGEVQGIDEEVDWNLELGAIIRRSYDLGAPAPLFRRIKGIEPGFRVLGAPAAVSSRPGLRFSRVALSLGLEPGASARELVDALASAHDRPPIAPRRLTSGAPCKENILRGADVDLLRFPAPLIHAGDGGRYINTWGVVIVRAPDGPWVNWAITRIMVLGRDRMVGLVAPRQHLGVMLSRWRERGRAMPFALALGAEPAVPFAGGMPLRAEVSEADFLGGYFGEPIDLVEAESGGLWVPATSEIVIEGEVAIDETALEGPMGEYTGYVQRGHATQQPVFRVSAVTFRDDPILPVVVAGEPIEEDHTCWGLGVASVVLADLRRAGFPVGTVFSPLESALHWLVITVDRTRRASFTKDDLVRAIREVVFPSKAGRVVSKLILVDDDVDPSDLRELVWAFATRCHPSAGQHLFPGVPVPPLQAYLDAEERRSGTSAKVVYDCLWPDAWREVPERLSFEAGWPAEVRERVTRMWKRYGY